jgi:hypothetical protein
MSASDDTDLLMTLIRVKLESIMKAKGFDTSYNHLTPAVREHYKSLLAKLVVDYFEEVSDV